MTKPRTLFDKIWDSHLVDVQEDGTCLIYIDRHLVHEITSAQAFGGLEEAGRTVRRPDLTLCVADHNVPTDPGRGMTVEDPEAQVQIDLLREKAQQYGIEHYDMDDIRQGIVHIIGPEQGLTQPGMTVVCGDSHTATHGAFGGLAFGIGTSEVEHVMATQTLQHGHRGRCPRRHDRPGRDHFRVLEGPPLCAEGRCLGCGGQLLENAALRPRREVR